MEIIIDTSFLLTAIKNKIDVLDSSEYGKLVLPKLVLEELEAIKTRDNSKNSDLAALALKFISKNKNKFKFIKLPRNYVDAGIIKYCEKNKCIVATLDKELKTNLKNKAKILSIRSKKKLILL